MHEELRSFLQLLQVPLSLYPWSESPSSPKSSFVRSVPHFGIDLSLPALGEITVLQVSSSRDGEPLF